MEYVRSQYRLQKHLDKWLKEEATKNNRSKNGQLNSLLEAATQRAEEKAA